MRRRRKRKSRKQNRRRRNQVNLFFFTWAGETKMGNVSCIIIKACTVTIFFGPMGKEEENILQDGALRDGERIFQSIARDHLPRR